MTTHGSAFRKGSMPEPLDSDDSVIDEGSRSSIPITPANGVVYEFTVSPKEQFYASSDRATAMYTYWSAELLRYLKPYATYELVTEVSYPPFLQFTPSTQCRIHYHGTVTFSNVAGFLVNTIHELVLMCTMKISDYRSDIWPAYLQKQEAVMKTHLGGFYTISSAPYASSSKPSASLVPSRPAMRARERKRE